MPEKPLAAMTDEELAATRTDIGNRLQNDVLTTKNERELVQRLKDVKAEQDKRLSAMSDEKLATTRDDLAERRKGMLSPEDRRELGARLNAVLDEIKRRAEVAEMQARYQS